MSKAYVGRNRVHQPCGVEGTVKIEANRFYAHLSVVPYRVRFVQPMRGGEREAMWAALSPPPLSVLSRGITRMQKLV